MNTIRSFVDMMRREKYEDVLEHYDGVDLVEGWAQLTSAHTLTVERSDGRMEISFDKALIATGSRPSIPPIKGIEDVGYYTTDNIWGMEELPGRILLVGGGAVGLEMGQALQRLGSQITLVEVLDRVLHGMKPEISKMLAGTLSAREGVVAASNMVSEGSASIDYTAVPFVVFTEPQVASVGLTERGVVERFGACSCRVVELDNVAKARMTGGRGL